MQTHQIITWPPLSLSYWHHYATARLPLDQWVVTGMFYPDGEWVRWVRWVSGWVRWVRWGEASGSSRDSQRPPLRRRSFLLPAKAALTPGQAPRTPGTFAFWKHSMRTFISSTMTTSTTACPHTKNPQAKRIWVYLFGTFPMDLGILPFEMKNQTGSKPDNSDAWFVGWPYAQFTRPGWGELLGAGWVALSRCFDSGVGVSLRVFRRTAPGARPIASSFF